MSAMKAIYVGLKQLGIEQEDARDLYERVTNVRSLKEMSENQRENVVQELRDQGFKKTSNGHRTLLKGKYAKKLQALWIACWNMGIIKHSSDEALLAFVKRQTGLDHTRFMHHAGDAEKVIEALKGMLAREGVDWTKDATTHDFYKLPGYKIAVAQWEKLLKRNNEGNGFVFLSTDNWMAFQTFAFQQSGNADPDNFSHADWIPVMNSLGRQIREAV
ncbi:MAG: regulatory protein GemA [Rhizobiaceae bacterium]